MSTTAGRDSYSTAMAASASSASARLAATTAQSGSPTQVTRSTASACWGAERRPLKWPSTPTHGVHTRASSAPVTTATIPGIALAAAVSRAVMRACASGLRRKATWVSRCTATSST